MSHVPPDPTASPAFSRPPSAEGGARAPLRILVVHADDAARHDIVQMVRSLGHATRTAGDGLEAEAMQQAERADAIVAAWDLPGIDGLELCRRVRAASGDRPYTHVILVGGGSGRDQLARAIEAGADDVELLPLDREVLHLRLSSARRVAGQYGKLAARNTVLRRHSEASFLAARVDPLTKVANRLRLSEDVTVLWSHARRYGHHYSAALCDIDWFKAYNDQYGHLDGDQVLVRVADAIRRGLRQGDGLYRYGGEEFLVLLPEQSLDEACVAMDRIRRSVERLAIPTVGSPGLLTISIGVSELSIHDDTVDDWLRRVDTALYLAKERGRNRVEGETERRERSPDASRAPARLGAESSR